MSAVQQHAFIHAYVCCKSNGMLCQSCVTGRDSEPDLHSLAEVFVGLLCANMYTRDAALTSRSPLIITRMQKVSLRECKLLYMPSHACWQWEH